MELSITGRTSGGGPSKPFEHGPVAIREGWDKKIEIREDFDEDRIEELDRVLSRYDSAGHGGAGLRRPGQWSMVEDQSAINGRALTCIGTPDGTTGGLAFKEGSQRFGRWGVRMRSRGEPGCLYNALALTWPDAENWMKGGGEIDFAEGGADANRNNFFLHFSTKGGKSDEQTHGEIADEAATYSWYEMEWTPTYVRGWCDGVLFFEDKDPKHFNYPAFGAHHLCLQLDWFPEGRKRTAGAQVWYDAVRIYSL